jgi:hypothetical protein
MIYLIGVRHDLQFEPAPTDVYKIVRDKRALFKAHVLEVIEKLGMTVLAEEFGDEAKTTWRVSESILEQFAKAKGIQHRFCDPDSIEKRALGIEVDPKKETDSDRDKRERVWLCRIGDCKNKNVLFVCGDRHFEPFADKLIASGFDVQRGPTYPISDKEEWETHGL